ncbi:MAG TPA: hypothetical protein VFE16_08975 [Candidatus Cybelea sp.]|nr:hypothetical protein [Candidatus Cybelea sp.]
MRVTLYAIAVLALAMLCAPETLRIALASAASSLFETAPFVFAGFLFARLFRRRCALLEYLSCGCGRGPSARSLPAAAATWILFGPFVAAARFVAAMLVAAMVRRRSSPHADGSESISNPLGELGAILPCALIAGGALQLLDAIEPARLSAPANALLGAILGFVASPCALGAVALGGALRVHAPVAAATFLCIAGIADLRALRGTRDAAQSDDAFAYAMLALALAIVAWRHGGALVHPAFAGALGCCGGLALVCACVYRRSRFTPSRAAPALMLAGAMLGAPPPQYHATETTLSDLFAGERLTFTGVLAREGAASSIVRYAITCCRADAAPIAVRLDRAPPYLNGTWLRVEGRITGDAGDLRLIAEHAERVATPPDPFLYR